MPFRQFVVKISSRCNLDCSYCYIYHHADQSWRRQPATMDLATVAALARRIGEHAQAHRLREIAVVLHGGEPLLAGPALVEHLVSSVRTAVPPTTRTRFTVQTNGVLLRDGFLELCRRWTVRVGVSVDGGRAAHDHHRRYRHGRGSFDEVCRALDLLRSPRYRDLYAGLLCTVDLDHDPIDVYESLLEFDPPRLDLLLPDGNWTHPPRGRVEADPATPYADWLITVFDRWYGARRRETGIRLFDSLIALMLGGMSGTEAVGAVAAGAITIATDGAIERNDALKSAAPGLAATDLSVLTDSFDAALAHPAIRTDMSGVDGLAATCRACSVVAVCGGGLLAHRYRAETGLANPSVYCPDLFRLVTHVRARVETDIRARAAARAAAATAVTPPTSSI